MSEDPVTPTPAPVSPRLSFKGWLLAIWLRKNKGFIKNVLAPVSTIVTGSAALAPEMLRPAAIVFGLGILTIAFKLGLDAFDYFVSEVRDDRVKEPRT